MLTMKDGCISIVKFHVWLINWYDAYMFENCILSAIILWLFYPNWTHYLTKWARRSFINEGYCLTLCQTSPGFYVSAVELYWKHCGKKEKLLVMNNFSFSHSVFFPCWELSASCFHQSWNCRLQRLSVWKSLKFVIWERVYEKFCFELSQNIPFTGNLVMVSYFYIDFSRLSTILLGLFNWND